MHILVAKFIYPQDEENLFTVLKPFQNLTIQLSFFKKQDFLQMRHRFIKETCDSLNINVPTIHAPTVDVFDAEFLKNYRNYKGNL